jgi:DNA invertase Pin-like site-specific DNA recombinase
MGDKSMAAKRKRLAAVGYVRTSSAANVGADKDSEPRQQRAIEAYAKRAGLTVVDWFRDPAVSGADPIESRPGFQRLLDKIEGNGVRIVLVEDASRFARDLMTQELGVVALIGRGVRVYTANGDDLTVTDDPMKVAMRQFAGVFAELEKSRLVQRLRKGREARANRGLKPSGRRTYAEREPALVALAKEIAARTAPGSVRKPSLRAVASELAERGYLSAAGTVYTPAAIKAMLR